MANNTRSISALRKNLLAQNSNASDRKSYTREVQFSNEDVPRFLAKLDAFEKASAKVKLRVG